MTFIPPAHLALRRHSFGRFRPFSPRHKNRLFSATCGRFERTFGSGELHDVGGILSAAQQFGHDFHGAIDVPEESLVAGT
jgi:hypothetical protein